MKVRPLSALALGVLLVASCSETDRVGEAEEGIAAVLETRLDSAAVGVTCPDDAALDEGATLTCAVAVGGAEPVDVPFEIGEGGSVRLAAAVLPTPSVEEHLRTELAASAEGEVAVECGDAPVLVRTVGGTIPCDVTRAIDGVGLLVQVEVQSLDGSVTYTVASTTVPATPAGP